MVLFHFLSEMIPTLFSLEMKGVLLMMKQSLF